VVSIMKISHIGQDVNDHVVLRGKGGMGGASVYSFDRIFPDGKVEDFAVPEDRFLIITDVQRQAQGRIIHDGILEGWQADFEPGDAAWPKIDFSDEMLFASRTIRRTTKGPRMDTSEQLNTGLVVGSGRLCARAQVIPNEIPSEAGGSQWVGNLGDGFLILRGYPIDRV
jgi:hypothetical protein